MKWWKHFWKDCFELLCFSDNKKPRAEPLCEIHQAEDEQYFDVVDLTACGRLNLLLCSMIIRSLTWHDIQILAPVSCGQGWFQAFYLAVFVYRVQNEYFRTKNANSRISRQENAYSRNLPPHFRSVATFIRQFSSVSQTFRGSRRTFRFWIFFALENPSNWIISVTIHAKFETLKLALLVAVFFRVSLPKRQSLLLCTIDFMWLVSLWCCLRSLKAFVELSVWLQLGILQL